MSFLSIPLSVSIYYELMIVGESMHACMHWCTTHRFEADTTPRSHPPTTTTTVASSGNETPSVVGRSVGHHGNGINAAAAAAAPALSTTTTTITVLSLSTLSVSSSVGSGLIEESVCWSLLGQFLDATTMHRLSRANQERILLTAHVWYYFVFIFVMEMALLIYKGYSLPYPPGTWALELVLLLLASATEVIRNFQGQKGNLTEQLIPLIISLALALPLIFSTLYFALWQTYVLRIEVITNSIQVILLSLEILLGILVAVTLSRYRYAAFT